MTFTAEYNNDVGPDDDGFWEWWEVRDPSGWRVCRCDDQSWAQKICDLLNAADAAECSRAQMNSRKERDVLETSPNSDQPKRK